MHFGLGDVANLNVRSGGKESRDEFIIKDVGLVVRSWWQRQILRHHDDLLNTLEQRWGKLLIGLLGVFYVFCHGGILCDLATFEERHERDNNGECEHDADEVQQHV